MKDKFEALLQEYRHQNVHFLKLKTSYRDLFLILDDAYYLTYRDASKEIAVSIPIKPKNSSRAEVEHYNTNNRSFDEWFNHVWELYETMSDKDEYNPPNFVDIRINYMNEDEKVPLKDFLAVLPKTDYKFFSDYIFFEKIGEGFEKVEKDYRVEESSINPLIRYWRHFDEIKPFVYEPFNPVERLAVNLYDILEIVPEYQSARFVFDTGSVQILKKLLAIKGAESK